MATDERPMKRQRLSDDEQLDVQDVPQESPRTNGQHEENALAKAETIQNGNGNKSGEETLNALPAPVDVAPLSTALDLPTDGEPLSKNQLKKLRRQQEWESKRDERKTIRKQKEKEKKQRKRDRYKEALENGDLLKAQADKPVYQKATQLPVTFLIDCDFDDLMADNERVSLAGQITRCYSDNRKSPFRAHLSVCSFNGKLRKRFDEVLAHHKGWKDVKFLDCDFMEASEKAKEWMTSEKGGSLAGVFAPLAAQGEDHDSELQKNGEIVYLTSESSHTLTELKPYSTYIIGGLVDKNREKGICYRRATQRGVKTARLPIGEFMEMQSRKVLATNHVNEVMLRWLECGDWGESFLKVIPKRKGGKLKGQADEDDNDDVGKKPEAAENDTSSEHGGEEDGDDDVPEVPEDVVS